MTAISESKLAEAGEGLRQFAREVLANGEEPIKGQTWTHFRGGKYQVEDVVIDMTEKNTREMVLYHDKNGKRYVREKTAFLALVDLPDGTKTPRFWKDNV